MNPERAERIEIPVLPLRDVVVYPTWLFLYLSGAKNLSTVWKQRWIWIKSAAGSTKEASTDEPGVNDLFSVGTVASVLQMLKLPDGTVKVLVEGLQRAHIKTLSDNGDFFSARQS